MVCDGKRHRRGQVGFRRVPARHGGLRMGATGLRKEVETQSETQRKAQDSAVKPCPSASPLAALPWARPRAKERCIRPVGHSEPHWNEIWEWESGKLGKVRTYRLPGVPRDPPPSASEIRRIVQDKLAGLMERQKKREARRARNNQCQNRRRGNRKGSQNREIVNRISRHVRAAHGSGAGFRYAANHEPRRMARRG